jgi:hypothetical protein
LTDCLNLGHNVCHQCNHLVCYKDNVNPYPEFPSAPPEAAQDTLPALPGLNTALEVDWGRRLRSSADDYMVYAP